MNIKGILVIFATVIPAGLLSAGIVFLIAFTGNMMPFSGESATPPIPLEDTSQAATANTMESGVADSSEPEEPARDYSYPQDFITVDDTYFENAVFLGDSRMRAFIKYCGISDLRAYSYMGLTVEKYFSEQTFRIGDSKLSASQALELDRDFDKVYLMFGTNELGWAFPDLFIQKYVEVINHIRECNPDAIIFVNSVLPVSEDAYKKQSFLKNETVWLYNGMLKEMAAEQEVYFLDLATMITTEGGALPDDASTDGIHPNREYVEKCFDFLRSHGIEVKPESEDDATMPQP